MPRRSRRLPAPRRRPRDEAKRERRRAAATSGARCPPRICQTTRSREAHSARGRRLARRRCRLSSPCLRARPRSAALRRLLRPRRRIVRASSPAARGAPTPTPCRRGPTRSSSATSQRPAPAAGERRSSPPRRLATRWTPRSWSVGGRDHLPGLRRGGRVAPRRLQRWACLLGREVPALVAHLAEQVFRRPPPRRRQRGQA
mmetsp:Transcript_16424/g.47054  ORF Transcript_16424/g.47054 Transcript_16424/m.47054 type:complete len:201 (+) Transcript_16424:407-1009(+)